MGHKIIILIKEVLFVIGMSILIIGCSLNNDQKVIENKLLDANEALSLSNNTNKSINKVTANDFHQLILESDFNIYNSSITMQLVRDCSIRNGDNYHYDKQCVDEIEQYAIKLFNNQPTNDQRKIFINDCVNAINKLSRGNDYEDSTPNICTRQMNNIDIQIKRYGKNIQDPATINKVFTFRDFMQIRMGQAGSTVYYTCIFHLQGIKALSMSLPRISKNDDIKCITDVAKFAAADYNLNSNKNLTIKYNNKYFEWCLENLQLWDPGSDRRKQCKEDTLSFYKEVLYYVDNILIPKHH